ncbi:MAG: DUF6496 domain-containing protein [Bacteroidota bacterium]
MAKYSKAAQKSVESSMKRMEKGTLRNGKSNKKVTNPKQAIAIGLSEAREKGAKVPKKKTAKKAAPKKTISKKATPKKVAATKKATSLKKAAIKKKAVSKQATVKKKSTKPDKNEMVPVETFETINLDRPPVEEKSPEIKPVIPDKVEDPIMVTDKKALAKAVTKHDFKHNIQLSGAKQSIRPSGKKPLWR